MARFMKITAAVISIIAFFLTVSFFMLDFSFLLSATITFWTFAYHLLMRLAVGWIIDQIMHNHANCYHNWFKLKKFEISLYRFLKIRKWKGKMPTYSPELFDASKHSYIEIAQAMCQAEIVHECIIVLSFLPLILAVFFGEFWIFLLTSLSAAMFDSLFVMMQRFNRPRILKISEHKNINHHNSMDEKLQN